MAIDSDERDLLAAAPATRGAGVAALGEDALAAEDAWGRPLAYLSLSAGRRYVLVSRGANGRLEHSLEGRAGGAGAGDDLVVLSGAAQR